MLWLYFIENGEITYHWGFILLKLLIKRTAVNLFETKKSCGLNSLKMLKENTTWEFFCWTPDKNDGCEFIENKEELWIYFIINDEIKYHYGFIWLKLLIKDTSVNLLKTKKSCVLISLKMLKESTTWDFFCWTPDKRYGGEFI